MSMKTIVDTGRSSNPGAPTPPRQGRPVSTTSMKAELVVAA